MDRVELSRELIEIEWEAMAPPEWDERMRLYTSETTRPAPGPMAELSAPAAPTVEQPPSRLSMIGALFREALETITLTFLIFLLIRGVMQNFRIEGYSMEPTLHAGQYLIVNKILYRLHPPERGDIIVFEYPKAPDRDFIKRVIGLPGEEVEIRNGKVYVNGIPLEENYISREPAYTYAKHTVGPDEVFVLGDNRNSSSDSHTWGMLPLKNIIGKAWVSYWPPKEWGLIPNHSFASSND